MHQRQQYIVSLQQGVCPDHQFNQHSHLWAQDMHSRFAKLGLSQTGEPTLSVGAFGQVVRLQ